MNPIQTRHSMPPVAPRARCRWCRRRSGHDRRSAVVDHQRPHTVRGLIADPWILIAVVGLLALGIVMVFNTSYFLARERFGDPFHFFRKHLMSIALGLAAALPPRASRPPPGDGSPTRC